MMKLWPLIFRLELEGAQAAEKGDIQLALEFLDQAVEVCPERASCYNNRAQARRLQGDTQGNCIVYFKP
jgi:hypothetical protein